MPSTEKRFWKRCRLAVRAGGGRLAGQAARRPAVGRRGGPAKPRFPGWKAGFRAGIPHFHSGNRRFRAFGWAFPAGNFRLGVSPPLNRPQQVAAEPCKQTALHAARGLWLTKRDTPISVFQQEFGGFRVGAGIFVLESGGLWLERPVFLFPEGVFLLPVPVACRKSPCSCSKPGRASREQICRQRREGRDSTSD